DEEEEFVLEDRTAEAAAPLVLLEVADRLLVRNVADKVRAAPSAEDRAGELVRSRARDGVDAAAGEAALADVIRRDDELELLDGVERDRLRARPAARSSRTGEA